MIKDGVLVPDVPAYSLRAFAVTLAGPVHAVGRVRSQPVALNFNFSAATAAPGARPPLSEFDGGRSCSCGSPAAIRHVRRCLIFPWARALGSTPWPAAVRRSCSRLEATGESISWRPRRAGSVSADFRVGGETTRVNVPEWTGYHVGQWDTRLWKDPQPKLAYIWNDALAGLQAGLHQGLRGGVVSSVALRHDSTGANERSPTNTKLFVQVQPGRSRRGAHSSACRTIRGFGCSR